MGQHLQDLGINPEGMNLVEMARLASQLGTNGQAQAVGTELPEPEVATFGDPTVTSPLPFSPYEEQFELAVRVLDATEDQLAELVNQYRLPIPEVNRSYSSIRDIGQALYEHGYLDQAYANLLAVPEIVSLSRDRYKRAVQGLGDAYGVQGSSQARILAQLYVNGVLIPDQRLQSNRAPWSRRPLDQGVYRTFTHLPRDYAWQMLRPYGDEQLMALFGLYLPYDDRRDLIQRLLDLRTQPGFFIPYIRRCQNRETVLGTPIKDLRFIVAFGTLYDYQCYELEELTGAFDFYEGAFSFRHPDFRATFTRDQIRDLETLLERYPEVEGRAQLLEKIQIGLRLLTTASAYDREVLGQFQSFSRAERAMIERMLQLIFEAGMYMRRWQGPGHPYPLRKEATMSPDDPTARVSRVLGEIRDLLNRSSPVVADFIRSLHQVQLFRGRVERSTEPFSEIYDEVFGCRACIRVASTYFIGTAYHYLQLLFDETIPGFDPEILDPIAYSPEELRAMRT